MKNEEEDLTRLPHIRDAIDLIEEFSSDTSFNELEDDLKTQSALVRQFEIVGEAIFHISSDLKISNSDIEWNAFRAFRNLLTHEYFRVDAGEVWSVIENDLPILKVQIQSLIEHLKNDASNS